MLKKVFSFLGKFSLHQYVSVATGLFVVVGAVNGYLTSTQSVSLAGIVAIVVGVVEHGKVTQG